jgi:hypothetical protein
MRLLIFLTLMFSSLTAANVWAQELDNGPADSAPKSSEAPAKPTFSEPPSAISMGEPLPGDYWTYESRDEITGKLFTSRTTTVTEVTPTNISVRISALAGSDIGFSVFDRSWNRKSRVFDRSWNRKSRRVWTYSPNDGLGVKSPLQVGAGWNFKCEAVDSKHGVVWVRNGSSKVLLKDKSMTKAGLFDTFLIESVYTLRRTTDTDQRATEITSRTWYAPAIDHWVRRTWTARTDGHLRTSNSFELIAYGRKE